MTCGTSGYWSGGCNNGLYGYGGLGYGYGLGGLGCGYGLGGCGYGLGGYGYGLGGCGYGYGLGGCGYGLGGCGYGLGGCGYGYGLGGCGYGLGGCGYGLGGYGLGLGCGINSYYPYYACSLPCFNQCYPCWGANCGLFPGYGNCYFPACLSGSYYPWYNQNCQTYTVGKRCKVTCN